jgi:VRR-NUC domain
MADPKPGSSLATGGMSREGTTTVVKINEPDIEPLDKKVLCAAMCKCDKAPNVGADGRQLKQACVAATMKEVDKQLDYKSLYKQEINYDMTKNPPEPIMDKAVPTKGHDWLPGWIANRFGKSDDPSTPSIPFKAGTGQIRRPDVVIVKDPSKPPTQDNIKQIVEMKFPPDQRSAEQEAEYKKIAGASADVKVLEPSDCDCNQPEPEPPKMPVQEIGTVATILMWIAFILSRGRTPRPQPI